MITGIPGKNLLINPLFLINQRGYVSGTATGGANQYTVDRWRVVTAGQNLTLSGSQATAPAGGLEQVVEGVLRGQLRGLSVGALGVIAHGSGPPSPWPGCSREWPR